MTYDQAIKQLEAIIAELENNHAISMTQYAEKAKQAMQLIAFCRQQLNNFDTQIHQIVDNPQ